MTSSALIAHVLEPLVAPRFAEQELLYDKIFSSGDDQMGREYFRGFRRVCTEMIDWAGDKLLVAGKDNMMRLFDPERNDEERSWPGEWMTAQSDPNQPHVAAAVSWNGKFKVFDTRTSANPLFDVDLKKSAQHMKEFLCLCWSPDSAHIALSNRQDKLYLLDMRAGGSLRLGASKALNVELNQMVWSPHGDSLWLATGSSTTGRVQIYPAPSLQEEGAASLVAHQTATVSIAADPTGRHMASGGADCLVSLWDPQHLVCTRALPYATQTVTTLGFNHTGALLAWGTGNPGSGSTGEKNLTIVNAHTGSLHWQDSTPAPVLQVRWHPKRNVLAYTLNASQLPDERDGGMRGGRVSGRDTAVVHLLKVPEVP